MLRRIALYLVLALGLVMYGPGCAKPSEVVVHAPKREFVVGDSLQIFTVEDRRVDTTETEFYWKSDNPSVALVDLFTGTAKFVSYGEASVCAWRFQDFVWMGSTRLILENGPEENFCTKIKVRPGPAK